MKENKYIIKLGTINGRQKKAIFHISNPDNPVSKWWDNIWKYGLVRGESEYYVVREDDDYTGERYALFHISSPDEPISKWWGYIFNFGIIKGKTEHYAVRREDGMQAVFHKDNPDEPVSEWLPEHRQIKTGKVFERYIKKLEKALGSDNEFSQIATKNNIQLKDFARKCDIPYNTVINWHIGISKPPKYIKKLLKMFIEEKI